MAVTDSGIYAIVGPNRQYIGSAKAFLKRWYQHRYLLRKGKHHCRALQNAFTKYGESAFAFKRLVLVPETDLLFYEQRFLDRYDRRELYNSTRTAAGVGGLEMSAEAKLKISISNKGRKRTPEHRTKIGAAVRGRPVGEAARQKMSMHQIGKKKSTNTSGYYGVSPFKTYWQAKVRRNGKQIYLGNFATPELANEAVIKFQNQETRQ